jgi:O-antigen biosynthesis protein
LGIAIVGSQDEFARVKKILDETPGVVNDVHHVLPPSDINLLAVQLNEVGRVHGIEQYIFCARDLSSVSIISTMSALDAREVEFKIAPPESLYIIGSGSIQTSGEAFMVDVNSIALPVNKRLKRFSDLLLCVCLLVMSPVLVLLQRSPMNLIPNWFNVLIGKRTWVGWHPKDAEAMGTVYTKTKSGILSPMDVHSRSRLTPEGMHKIWVIYARDYRVWNDWNIVAKNLRNLGQMHLK